MSLKSDCVECQKFDEETKLQMRALFGSHELIMISLMLAGALKDLTVTINKKRAAGLDKSTFAIVQQRDMASLTVGKFMVAMEEQEREFVRKTALSNMGIALSINHQPCPHEKVAEPASESVKETESGQ